MRHRSATSLTGERACTCILQSYHGPSDPLGSCIRTHLDRTRPRASILMTIKAFQLSPRGDWRHSKGEQAFRLRLSRKPVIRWGRTGHGGADRGASGGGGAQAEDGKRRARGGGRGDRGTGSGAAREGPRAGAGEKKAGRWDRREGREEAGARRRRERGEGGRGGTSKGGGARRGERRGRREGDGRGEGAEGKEGGGEPPTERGDRGRRRRREGHTGGRSRRGGEGEDQLNSLCQSPFGGGRCVGQSKVAGPSGTGAPGWSCAACTDPGGGFELFR